MCQAAFSQVDTASQNCHSRRHSYTAGAPAPTEASGGGLLRAYQLCVPFPLERKQRDMVDLLFLVVVLSA